MKKNKLIKVYLKKNTGEITEERIFVASFVAIGDAYIAINALNASSPINFVYGIDKI